MAQTREPERCSVQQATVMVLIGLGLTREGTRPFVTEATILIRGRAPDRLA